MDKRDIGKNGESPRKDAFAFRDKLFNVRWIDRDEPLPKAHYGSFPDSFRFISRDGQKEKETEENGKK